MKTVRKMFVIFLMLGMLFAHFPQSFHVVHASVPGYDPNAALKFAEENVLRTNVSWLCAEFIFRVVRAGGLNIPATPVLRGTGDINRAIARAMGIEGWSNNNQPIPAQIPQLVLNSNGHATKQLNGDTLMPGDVVFQWCFGSSSCRGPISPHVLLFSRYDSNGIARFYARNKNMADGTYPLHRNSALHPNCRNLTGFVLQIAPRDTTLNNSPTATPFGTPSNIRVNNHVSGPGHLATFSINEGEMITVTWNAVANADRYRVEPIFWNGSAWEVSNGRVQHVTSTSASFTNLPPPENWGFRVTAGNEHGWATNAATWHNVNIVAKTTVQPFNHTVTLYEENGRSNGIVDETLFNFRAVTNFDATRIVITVGNSQYNMNRTDSRDYFFKTYLRQSGERIITVQAYEGNVLRATHSIHVSAEPQVAQATITATASSGGSATGTSTVPHNTPVEIRATANNGWTFSGWFENGTLLSSANPLTVNQTDRDRVIEARFTQNQTYTVTLHEHNGRTSGIAGETIFDFRATTNFDTSKIVIIIGNSRFDMNRTNSRNFFLRTRLNHTGERTITVHAYEGNVRRATQTITVTVK
jgi:hypothetical protein